ncbi:nuclear transcription factor Y subunit A-10-like isoform X2 [Tripterygium wilfordii]|uniref:nuclear transcription factor Y subunit A-10-like isoform X2 n=1 Tax=Tripterygium wilfordii TaxID=458696 RepID=UPI0018F83EBA|nr:nuclear transcription factor Y subunit A-10-like isoform X2 [Tripterygium wilfordii]
MAMQTVYLKEHEGIVQNSIGQLSSIPSVTWWNAICSQSVHGDLNGRDQLTVTKQGGRVAEHGLDKGDSTHFTIFPGDGKTSGEGKKHQGAISIQSSPQEYSNHFGLGFGQPMICANDPHMDQCYGLFSTYGAQISGRIMLPLSLSADDGPIYVNAKQYNGIMRRRQSRAKAVLENKIERKRKPYMHHSRHLHALRRPRGCGGRFLNTKTKNGKKGEHEMMKASDAPVPQPTGSQSSEVLQSESGNLNSFKEANGNSNLSGSEVTSIYSRGGLNHYSISYLGPSVQPLSGFIPGGRGTVMPSKWVAAASNCCNHKD